jgi:hypothetical protein
MLAGPAGAQSPAPAPAATAAAKKAVTSQDDLPRFTYPVAGTASALYDADDATFDAFSARVKADIDGVLAGYDIQDHATLRGLLTEEIEIAMLAGATQAEVEPLVVRVRALEDKPDAKLLSGLRTEAIYAARADAGTSSGPLYLAAFAKRYQSAIAPLPWPVVGNSLKEGKSGLEFLTPAILTGRVQGDLDPIVAKTHSLSGDAAAGLINLRFARDIVAPLKPAMLAVLTPIIAAFTTVKPDIWTARDVTLTAAQHLTPVRVGIWDGGSDISLFPGRVYTDPADPRNPHGFAFDLINNPTTGVLYPLTPAQRALFPKYVRYYEGLADLQASIDSPAADELKRAITSMSAADVPAFFENLDLYGGTYSHGTHVAGIAMRGNPAARIVVGRITYDYKTIPTAPSDAIQQRGAAANFAAVAYFKAHHVRVVNMSWGDNPDSYEGALEKNGIGADATARKALARHYFLINRDSLYAALKSAPGVLFVCAAGNSNEDSGFGDFIPADFDLPNLLVVGAVDQAGDETSFTSYGKTVKVDADGYHVPSFVPGGAIVRLSGTSMASPNVANLAAKLLALDPKLTPTQVVALIVGGATPSSDGRRNLIDPKASVAKLEAMLHAPAAH